MLPSPYRSVLKPLVDYVKRLEDEGATDLVTIVVPEIVPRRWWEHLASQQDGTLHPHRVPASHGRRGHHGAVSHSAELRVSAIA